MVQQCESVSESHIAVHIVEGHTHLDGKPVVTDMSNRVPFNLIIVRRIKP
jgi:hypothetical protein